MATRGRLKWTKRSTRVKTGTVRARLFHPTMQSVVFRLLFAARLVESGSAMRTPRTNTGTRACSYPVSTNLTPHRRVMCNRRSSPRGTSRLPCWFRSDSRRRVRRLHHPRKFIVGILDWASADKFGASMTKRMKIEHAASWVSDLERACSFYERWFKASKGPQYSSTTRPFTS